MRVGLLTGSSTAKEKRERKAALKEGELDLIIGTHALITGDTAFRDLGLVVTDEQQKAPITASFSFPFSFPWSSPSRYPAKGPRSSSSR